MQFLTFYYSGTGNTKWAAEQFHKIVTEKGQKSELVSIDTMNVSTLAKYRDAIQNADFIGFATPIYGGNIPPIMRRFIGNFLALAISEIGFGKLIYFINTFAYVNGFGPLCAKRLFHGTPFCLVGYVNITMCNNTSTPKLKVKPISQEKLQKRKETAKAKLAKFTDRLLAGNKYIEGIGFYLIPNILVRKISEKSVRENYKIFDVQMDTCKKCMLCIKNCPTESIQYTNNTFQFLPSCTACMRCYNYCPTCSILFDGKYADPAIYARYCGPDTNG